jgi:hypothetical protein
MISTMAATVPTFNTAVVFDIALRRLEGAAIHAVRVARRAKRDDVSLSNVKARTRDQRVRLTGRGRSVR